MGKVSPVKQALVQHLAPGQAPLPEKPGAAVKVRRAKVRFGMGSAVSYECDSWMRWTGV
jgi:hypothetical protein